MQKVPGEIPSTYICPFQFGEKAVSLRPVARHVTTSEESALSIFGGIVQLHPNGELCISAFHRHGSLLLNLSSKPSLPSSHSRPIQATWSAFRRFHASPSPLPWAPSLELLWAADQRHARRLPTTKLGWLMREVEAKIANHPVWWRWEDSGLSLQCHVTVAAVDMSGQSTQWETWRRDWPCIVYGHLTYRYTA